MRKHNLVHLLFVIGGLAIALAAVFAEQLGIDRSAGWGRGRVVLLVTGILIVVVAALAWLESGRTDSIVKRLEGALRGATWGFRLLDATRSYWLAIPLDLFVVFVYVWLVSSGTWTQWVSPTRYYADLARGFQQGHLYLATKVNAELLTLADPYEPLPSGGTRGPIDYSYYNGKYYLPWGPVPALIVLAWHGLFHIWLGDLQLTFGFVCGIWLAELLLAMLIWANYFRNLPKSLLWMSILLLGLAGPVPFMLNNYLAARIYEAAVTGGQFFMLAGLFLALLALERSSLQWIFGLAGALWALAVGTRLDLVLPIVVMAVFVTAWVLRVNGVSGRSIRNLAILMVPLALGGALLAWYNWARFGSFTESGYFYQLAGLNLHKHWDERFSLGYILPNFYAYLISPVNLKPAFPFLDVAPATTPGSAAFQPAFPHFYLSQIITGLAWLSPFVVFALIPMGRTVLLWLDRKRAGRTAAAEMPGLLSWIQLTLASSSLVTFVFLMLYFWAAMRFLVDFFPSLILLGAIGFWLGYDWVRRNPTWKWIYTSIGISLAAASIVVSLLAAISASSMHFPLAALFQIVK